MRLRLIILAALLLCGYAEADTNTLVPIRTNFVAGATLSVDELDTVVRLANLCGIEHVTEVRTYHPLPSTNFNIEAKSAERVEGRKVMFEVLEIHREGWSPRVRAREASKSLGDFWVEATARPRQQEFTIFTVGGHTLRVGLLNGIKTEGADKIIEAFLAGRVRYASDRLKAEVSGMDFSQPSWMGIAGGRCWITFSSPFTQIIFRLNGNEVIILDVIRMYA